MIYPRRGDNFVRVGQSGWSVYDNTTHMVSRMLEVYVGFERKGRVLLEETSRMPKIRARIP